MSAEHPLFEVVTTTAGAVSIRNKILNETMHNPVGPWAEAHALYILPSGLKEKLSRSSDGEFVLFDVGLGAAANSLSVLHCHRSLENPRPLRLVSFEREMELLRFALKNAHHFEHFRGFEDAMESILANGRWEAPGVRWELRKGDFLELIDQESARPDLVFYDPYSMAVNAEMWSVDCFRKIRRLCKSADEGGSVLLNYSRATPFRTALLMAGFYVGQGPATGLKDETTQAATRLEDLSLPLGDRWIDRWKRSHARTPPGISEQQMTELQHLVLEHPQFRS